MSARKTQAYTPKIPLSLEAVRDLDPRLVYTVQSVQNATARLITGTRRSDHNTRTPLATHPTERQVQSGMRGSPVAVRAGASLLADDFHDPSRVRQHSALSVVS